MPPCLNEEASFAAGPLRIKCPRLDCLVAVAYFACTGAGLRTWIDWALSSTSDGILPLHGTGRGGGCDATHISANGFFIQNMLGCMLISMAQEHKATLGPATYAGIGAGLCGSLTTFASWLEYIALAILQGKILTAIAVLIGMLCASYCSHMFGKVLARPGLHLFKGHNTDDDSDSGGDLATTITSWLPAILAHILTVVVGVGVFAWLAIVGEWEDLVAIGLAPLGSLTRYILSLGNPKCPQFPIFTLLANILGCAVYVGADAYSFGFAQFGTSWEDEVLAAAATGIGGCLSTVSTFINELRNKSIYVVNRWVYALVSFGLALALFLPIESSTGCFPHY